MSWYSIIYVYVRNFRQRRPILGYFLHLSLNVLSIVQLIGLSFSYYVYNYVTCETMLTNTIQRCIYLSIYNSIFFMLLWSLFQTTWTPTSRVPDKFKADSTFDEQIKEITPYVDGRYMPYNSTEDQALDQKAMLDELVQKKRLNLMETDNWGRYRYCYQCSHLKPDRCHHCNSCGNCTVRFDHHCPWINKCISHGNYKFFLLYIFYGCLFIACFEALTRYFMKPDQIWVLDEIIQVASFMITHGRFGYVLGDLIIYHYKLISENETTCEQDRPPIMRGDEKATYNQGRYHNFRSVFGWGLWLFPVDTTLSDGIHFPVRYSSECESDEKPRVQEINAEDKLANSSNESVSSK